MEKCSLTHPKGVWMFWYRLSISLTENFEPESYNKSQNNNKKKEKKENTLTHTQTDFMGAEPKHLNLMNGKCFQVNKQQIYVWLLFFLLLQLLLYFCVKNPNLYIYIRTTQCVCVCKCTTLHNTYGAFFISNIETALRFNFFRSHNSSFGLVHASCELGTNTLACLHTNHSIWCFPPNKSDFERATCYVMFKSLLAFVHKISCYICVNKCLWKFSVLCNKTNKIIFYSTEKSCLPPFNGVFEIQ